MRKIECDICSRDIKNAEHEDLTDFTKTILTYGGITNPDICFNCLDNLSKVIKEAIIKWKLGKGN